MPETLRPRRAHREPLGCMRWVGAVLLASAILAACDASPRCGTGTYDEATGTCRCPMAADAASTCVLPRDAFMVEAHRGARSTVPPGNTLPSFIEAIHVGADVLEGDMLLTFDGAVILNHDPTLSAACVYAGPGPAPATRVVAALTADEVALFDCHPTLAGIDAPPRVEDVLDLHTRANVEFDLELKEMGIPEADVAMSALRDYDEACGGCLEGRLRVQSFDLEVLRHVRGTFGSTFDFETSFLSLTGDAPLAEVAEVADVLAPLSPIVDATLVDAAHAAGLRVLPWTVNTEATMCSLIALGVDGIISDDPGLLAEALVRCR